jgi:hypothetical protein
MDKTKKNYRNNFDVKKEKLRLNKKKGEYRFYVNILRLFHLHIPFRILIVAFVSMCVWKSRIFFSGNCGTLKLRKCSFEFSRVELITDKEKFMLEKLMLSHLNFEAMKNVCNVTGDLVR